MRLSDIARMALQTVRQQKARTALSCGGVVIGSLMLIVSLAARDGVELAVRRIFSVGDRLRRIEVFSSFRVKEEKIPTDALEVKGEMDEDKRGRIRKMLIDQWQRERNRQITGIDDERLAQIRAIEHVVEVIPTISESGQARFGTQSREITCIGAAPDNKTLQERILAGSCFTTNNQQGVLVHEFLAYQWGFNKPQELEQLVGKTIRLSFGLPPKARETAPVRAPNPGEDKTKSAPAEKGASSAAGIPQLVDQVPLPNGLKSVLRMALGASSNRPLLEVELPILGIYRGASEMDDRLGRWLDWRGDATVVLPYQTAADLVKRVPERAKFGFAQVTAIVDSEDNLKEVMSQIQDMDLRARSLIDFVEIIQAQIATVTWVLSALAAIALFVSALGITNTMVMSVVERTHEIGVMKAVGARDGHIQLLFLFEGALIGLLGAAVAVLFAWLASYPLDSLARAVLDRRLHNTLPGDRVVFFPLYLAIVVPAFSALVTTLAGLIPARRAARISPIVALRHE